MNKLNKKLMVEQLDRKLAKLHVLSEVEVPSKGWINAIRTTLNMSLVQLARRLKKTSVTVRELRNESRTKLSLSKS